MSTVNPTRRFVRSWKERFNPNAELIFIKRLRLGVPGAETVQPGDAVTPEIRAALGRHRLKVWWEARVIGTRSHAIAMGFLPEEAPKNPQPPTLSEIAAAPPLPAPSKSWSRKAR